MPRRTKAIAGALAIALLAFWGWRSWWPDDKRDIRRRLNAFESDFNDSTTDGLGAVARAARIGSYFTDDVVVELGQGSPPIRGRETLIGMASRLQTRTSAFTLQLLDIQVEVQGPSEADVRLTASFRRRSLPSGDESIDAQEFAVRMVKTDGEWRMSHVTAVEPFR
ncbi:MAG: nuclear transport factor 2 family protein [Vicinamibacterales bacterium]